METPIDKAYSAMVATQEEEQARLRFHERLIDAEWFLLLTSEAEGETISPEEFTVAGVSYLVAFDREERLVSFAQRPSPYIALSGRALVRMMSEKKVGLAINLGAVSEHLVPPETVDWLAKVLAQGPHMLELRPLEVLSPVGLSERLLQGLNAKLATATGLARYAWLATANYEDGQQRYLLAFVATLPGAENGLAQAVSEALTFSGVENDVLDVAFLAESDPLIDRLARVAFRFDLPEAAPKGNGPKPPGLDPDKPPRLI